MFDSNFKKQLLLNKRINYTYISIFVLFAIFLLRLFYVQVIDYGSYKTQAADYQLKQYEIPPTRGQINILDGNNRSEEHTSELQSH